MRKVGAGAEQGRAARGYAAAERLDHVLALSQRVDHRGEEAVAGADRASHLHLDRREIQSSAPPREDGAIAAQGDSDEFGAAAVDKGHCRCRDCLVRLERKTGELAELADARLHQENPTRDKRVLQRWSGGVEDEPSPPLAGGGADADVEVVRRAGRQRSAHDHEVALDPGQGCEARLAFGGTDPRSRGNDPELPAAIALQDDVGDPRMAGYLDVVAHQLVLVDQAVERLTRRAPGQVAGACVSAQADEDPRDVDAATPRGVAFIAPAQLQRVSEPVDGASHVDRRVHR